VLQFLPAGEAQLLQFKVDGVGLVAASTLAVGEEEMRVRIGWQRDGSCSGCWPGGGLAPLLLLLLLLLKGSRWHRCVTS
jgi:uncharacterized protein (TIGR03382 family)